MAFFRLPSRRMLGTALAAFGVFAAAACADKVTQQPVEFPDDVNLPPNVRQAAFVFDVDLNRGKVNVIAPNGQSVGSLNVAGGGASPALSLKGGNGKALSILAGDVIEVTAGVPVISDLGVGGAPAGRLFVSFDVNIFNRLGSVRLIRPTFPAPPAGLAAAQQVLMFPFAVSTVVTAGGTTTGGDGTEITVETPSRGAIEAVQSVTGAADPLFRDAFDGGRHNFFDDTLSVCAPGNPNCFFYEPFPVIQPNETTTNRRIGFVIDPTVSRFRARLLIAADLENAVAQFGTIAGTVSSAILTPSQLDGLTVETTTGGFTGDVGPTGAYSIPNVPVGSRTVTVRLPLPAGCSVTPVTVSVANAATATANFPLAGCTGTAGTVSGQFNNSLGGGLPGVIVTASTGQVDTTDATGAWSFSISTAPAGASGTLAYSINPVTYPSNCANPLPTLPAGILDFSLPALSTGNDAQAAFTVTCTAPPPYAFLASTRASSRAGSPAAERDLLLGLNLSGDFPANTPDAMSNFEVTVNWNPAQISVPATGRSFLTRSTGVTYAPVGDPGEGLNNITANFANIATGALNAAFTSNIPEPTTTNFNGSVGGFRFTCNAGFTGTANLTVVLTVAGGAPPTITNVLTAFGTLAQRTRVVSVTCP